MSYATLNELREKHGRLVTNARSLLEEITDETPEERAKELEDQFDKAMVEADEVEAQAQRMHRLESVEQRIEHQPDPRRPQGSDGVIEGEVLPAVREKPDYKDVFIKAIRYGTAALEPEERALMVQNRTDLPPEVRAQGTTPDPAGGYTVPEDFSNEIDIAMAAWGPMWDPGVTREVLSANGRDLPWPTTDDTAARGRLKAENDPVQDDGSDDVVFSEVVFNAYVYDTGMVRVSMELLQDSAFDMEALLRDLFAERMGRTANDILTNGTGTAQPNGIVTASAAGPTTASGTAIASDELFDLQHSVDPAYRASPQCRWQFNDMTLAAIRKLKDGQNNYLWQMGDIRVGEPSMLLGHPYSVNQAMADIGVDAKAVIFGDHSRYVVRKVIGFQVLTLRERYAENFQIGLVGFKRFDGDMLNANAVKHLLQNST